MKLQSKQLGEVVLQLRGILTKISKYDNKIKKSYKINNEEIYISKSKIKRSDLSIAISILTTFGLSFINIQMEF